MSTKDLAMQYLSEQYERQKEAERVSVHYRLPQELKDRLARLAELTDQYEVNLVIDLLDDASHDLAHHLVDGMENLSKDEREQTFMELVYGDEREAA